MVQVKLLTFTPESWKVRQKSVCHPANAGHCYFRTKQDICRRLIDASIDDWDRALENISPERDRFEAIQAYIGAKFEHARVHLAETRLFASEVMTGARFLSPATRRHMRDITTRHADVIDSWIADGKIAPVDSRHFLVMIRATSEFYSFFDPLVCDALSTGSLKASEFQAGADAFVTVVMRALRPDTEHAS